MSFLCVLGPGLWESHQNRCRKKLNCQEGVTEVKLPLSFAAQISPPAQSSEGKGRRMRTKQLLLQLHLRNTAAFCGKGVLLEVWAEEVRFQKLHDTVHEFCIAQKCLFKEYHCQVK